MQNKKGTIQRKSIQNPEKKDTSSVKLCRTIYTATFTKENQPRSNTQPRAIISLP